MADPLALWDCGWETEQGWNQVHESFLVFRISDNMAGLNTCLFLPEGYHGSPGDTKDLSWSVCVCVFSALEG